MNKIITSLRYLGLVFLVIFGLMAIVATGGGGGDGDDDTTATTTTTTTIPITDYASEAGNDLSIVPVQGVPSFTLTDTSGTTVASNSSTSGSTSSGVLSISATLSSIYTDVRTFVNGIESEVSSTSTFISSDIVLSSGTNYICVLIYQSGSRYGRSEVVRVSSEVTTAFVRFQLKWSGSGDVDLHVDDGSGGSHCYFGYSEVLSGGWSMELDVDNMSGYGPENIRIYEAPSGSTIRCFVNYWSGSISQNATVYVYQNGVLLSTFEKTLSSTDANGLSSYNDNSWHVVSYTVN